MRKKNIIIGAGLSGLSVYQQIENAIILEKESICGGTASSFTNNAASFDKGIHVINTLPRVGIGCISNAYKRDACIITNNGSIHAYPFQKNGVDNEIKKTPPNYLEYLLEKFGDKDCRDFHVPYNQKFWKIPLDKMSASWANTPYVPKKNKNGSYGANSLFWYPKLGNINAIARSRYARVKPRVSYEEDIIYIDIDTKRVHTASRKYKYDTLYSSMPLTEMNIKWGKAKGHVDNLKHTTIACFNFQVNNKYIYSTFKDKHWVYFTDTNIPFIRVSFPSNYGGHHRSGHTTIQCEISVSPWDRIEDFSFYGEFLKTVGITRKKPNFVSKHIINVAYCIPTLTLEDDLRNINEYLAKYDIVPIGRYGTWKNLWMHEAINFMI